MTAAAVPQDRRARVTRTFATPTTAVVLGAISLVLLIASVPLAALDHQLTLSGYGFGGLATLPFALMGLLVARRRPHLRMGWIMLGVSLLQTLSTVGGFYAVLDYRIHQGRLPLGWLAALVQPSWLPSFAVLGLAIVLYPDGRLPSPRWRWPVRWLAAISVAWQLGTFALVIRTVLDGTVRIETGGDLRQFDHPTGGWVLVSGLLLGFVLITVGLMVGAWLVRQLLGYRHLTGERRVQQKWVITGAVVSLLAVLTSVLPAPFSSATNQLSVSTFTSVGLAALPVAMGVGILKYRLYEIDRIVSRTLSYALLSAVLVGAFIGLVALTTDVLPFSSSVGVAASTLVAAALFNPLRGRVQRVVDRRFNRARYDAEATVDAFAARLRDAVDLDAVQAELLEVVQRTVEPSHATVWLRRAARD
jgi:hypothetical protein